MSLKKKILIGALTLGVLGGYGSGIAHLVMLHRAWNGDGTAWAERWRCGCDRDGPRWRHGNWGHRGWRHGDGEHRRWRHDDGDHRRHRRERRRDGSCRRGHGRWQQGPNADNGRGAPFETQWSTRENAPDPQEVQAPQAPKNL